jgi:hypothetical protein
MSPLPERKKSPGEIAKLRESLGVPVAPMETKEPSETQVDSAIRAVPVDTIVSTNHEATVVHCADPAALPKPALQPVRSLKRSERVAAQEAGRPVTPPTHEPKAVRSLRKSERLPSTPYPESPPDSNLPHQRHSDEEIAEIRRREVFAIMNAKPNPKLSPAHPGIIIPGYLSAFAGAASVYFYQFPIAATLAFAAVSLMVAAFIGIRKPISRHHAAFIAVIALFVIIFGALHYFPQLRHAT